MSPAPRRVLIVRLSAMGDVMHGVGAVRALQRARPDWSLTWVVQRSIAPLLAGWPGLEVVEHDRASGIRGIWRTARILRRSRFDVALDFQGNWKSAVLARASGAGERIGAARRWRREPGSARLLTRTVGDAIPDASPVLHPARLALEVVQSVAPQARAEPPQLRATDTEVEAEAAALRRLGVDLDAPFRVFVWTDPADNRAWRPGAMARSAARSEAPVVWLAGPAEAHLDDPPGAIVLRHGRGEVRRLLALGEVVRRARGDVVGPDQGASHVLAAAGAPTAVLFGPQDPEATAPQGARVVRCDPAPACMPCRSRTCDHEQGPVCMAHEL